MAQVKAKLNMTAQPEYLILLLKLQFVPNYFTQVFKLLTLTILGKVVH